MSTRPKPPIAPRPIPDDPRMPARINDAKAAAGDGPRMPARADGAPASVGEERLYRAGRPSLRGFVHYVHNHAREPVTRDALVERWQEARARLTMLERLEGGAADHPQVTSLGPRYEPLLLEFFKNPLVRRSFNTLPTDIALVPLDQLVVYQKHIDLDHRSE